MRMSMALYWELVLDEQNLTSPKVMRALLAFHDLGSGLQCQCLNCLFLRVRLKRLDGTDKVFRVWS